MASRHLSRALVLQTLFESDVSGTLDLANAKRILKRNASEFSLGDSDMAFADSLLTGILTKQSEIDAVLVKAAPQWPLDKIAPIDRNVLRIGLYELLFGDRSAVPPKVALNEAIEIGKSFGGDASGKFVNGVLGAVYRDIGEPQKADAPRAAELKAETLGGAVVIAITNEGPQVALVLDAFKRWTLPKTHCEEGEITQSAALRAIKNELGIDATIVAPLAEHTYRANDPSGTVDKTVAYFAASADPAVTLQCIVCDGILEAKWYTPDQLAALPMYEDLRAIIDQGLAAVTHDDKKG